MLFTFLFSCLYLAKSHAINSTDISLDDYIPRYAVKHVTLSEPAIEQMYEADPLSNSIVLSQLDGSQKEVVIENLDIPYGVAINPDGTKLYWTSSDREIFRRANLDGSNVESILSTFEDPYTIEINTDLGREMYTLSNNSLYWFSLDDVGEQLDSELLAELDPDEKIHGIAVDLDAKKIFWGDQFGRIVGEASTEISGDRSAPLIRYFSYTQ